MLLPIVVYGHPVLRKIAEDIPADFPDLDKFLQDMFQTMDEADGVGLAAPQVGKSIRVFVVDGNAFAETDPECAGFRKAFINAHIIERSGEEISRNEGCLSIPGIHEDVKRKNKSGLLTGMKTVRKRKKTMKASKPGLSSMSMTTWKAFFSPTTFLL